VTHWLAQAMKLSQLFIALVRCLRGSWWSHLTRWFVGPLSVATASLVEGRRPFPGLSIDPISLTFARHNRPKSP
jgi:hypothetical protein